MTQIENVLPLPEPSASEQITSMMDDDAYLMTIVDTDSLLPSNLTFSGLFEGDNGLISHDEITGKSVVILVNNL